MRRRIHHSLVRAHALLRAVGRLAPLLTATVAACTAGPDPHATYPLVLALMGFSSPSIPGGTLSFDGAAWSPPTPFTPVTDAQVFGGITVLDDGRALAVLGSEPHRTTFATTVGSGSTWSSLGETDGGDVLALLSAPAPTPTSAVVLTQSQLGAVHVATFDAATSTWSAGEHTGLSVPTFHSPPVVVPLANGEDLVAMTLGPDRSFQLLWTRRTHGVWSAPAPVPGLVAVNILPTQALTRFAAVRRPRTDQVVVVATTDSDPRGLVTNVVSATTLTGDTWSTPVALTTDIDTSGGAVALAPLRDGRVALGHAGSGGSGDDGSFGSDCPDGHTRYIHCYRGDCHCIANPTAFVGDQFTLPESCATPLGQVSALAYSPGPRVLARRRPRPVDALRDASAVAPRGRRGGLYPCW